MIRLYVLLGIIAGGICERDEHCQAACSIVEMAACDRLRSEMGR